MYDVQVLCNKCFSLGPRLSHEAVTVIELCIEGPKLNCEKRPLCFLFLRYDTAIHFFYVYVEYF